MSYRVRIADRFKTQSAERFITTGGPIINGVTGNPSFSSMDLKMVQAAVDDLNAALAAQPHGGSSATAISAGNTPGSWQTAGFYTNSRSMTIDCLTPGTTYMFQLRTIGGSTRYSDWSNPVSRMCA